MELACAAFVPSVGGSCWEGTCPRAALLHASFQRASWAGRWVLELVWLMVPRALEIESFAGVRTPPLHSQLPSSLDQSELRNERFSSVSSIWDSC